jgi:glutaminyl-peptide cyclotransferase
MRRVAAAFVVLAAVLAGCGDDAGADRAAASTTSAPGAPTTTLSSASTNTSSAPANGDTVERLRVEVIERRPHDRTAFTQGLELHGDSLYESDGLYGKSAVRVLDPQSGAVRDKVSLDDSLFAEGLTIVGDDVVVITWREHTALVLDPATLDNRGTHSYAGEGWGVCGDGTRLVMSDGTATLRFRDPSTFAETGSVDVTLDGAPVTELNELECVDGTVYANVWHSDTIMRIDPQSGRVTATIDASGLLPDGQRSDPEAVLNGIAYDRSAGTFLLTGKLWPALFEVRFVPAG